MPEEPLKYCGTLPCSLLVGGIQCGRSLLGAEHMLVSVMNINPYL